MTPTRTLSTSAALAAALVLTGCAPWPATSTPALPHHRAATPTPAPPAPAKTPTPATPDTTPSQTTTALAELSPVPVKGRAPKAGYSRKQFGQAWKDIDRNGCDTRNDTLRRDLTNTLIKPGTHGCLVLSGHLSDPYTGAGVDFVRGGVSEVDIDHLVPLADAWQKGAQGWDQDKRERLANDPLNLAATAAGANRSKGDSDLATWLPANRTYWCTYTVRIVNIKARYGLWMTPAEHTRAHQILTTCPQ